MNANFSVAATYTMHRHKTRKRRKKRSMKITKEVAKGLSFGNGVYLTQVDPWNYTMSPKRPSTVVVAKKLVP